MGAPRIPSLFAEQRLASPTALSVTALTTEDVISGFSDSVIASIMGPIESAFPNVAPTEIATICCLSIAMLLILVLQPPANLLTKEAKAKIVAGTFLEEKELQRVYKASKDGWSALAFHEAVDGEGSGLVAVKGINGKIFGGYNPSGWRSTDDYFISSAAFLWCFKGTSVVKLPILPGGNCAVFDYATAGPTFGSTDFVVGPQQAAVMGGFAGPDTEDITSSAGNLRQCRSSIGTAYKNDPVWPARGAMKLVEVEVYCAAR